MKIEMGESLMQSWLKHIKGCEFSQLNWKPSEVWKTKQNDFKDIYIGVKGIYEKINNKDFFNTLNLKEITDKKIFGGSSKKQENKDTKESDDSTFEQIIKQAEIDVLGYNFQENKLYAIDIAFHEAGLLYGKDTVLKVMQKILRSALILKLYFPEVLNYEIIFASPKIGPTIFKKLTEKFKTLNNNKDIFEMKDVSKLEFKLYGNETFKDEIFKKLVSDENLGKIADTSELFVRSMQLSKLCS